MALLSNNSYTALCKSKMGFNNFKKQAKILASSFSNTVFKEEKNV